MKKIILFNAITVDGYFEGPNQEIDWHQVDEEFNEFAIEQLKTADTLLFGRITYELMAGYWPTPQAITDDPRVAEIMNSIPKIVFSKTLKQAPWNNTRLVNSDAAAELARLKQQPGKDMLIFGSGDLASSLIKAGLIDEFRLLINPVILGSGHPMFKGLNEQLPLTLLKTRTFKNGNVLLYYQPKMT